MKRRARSRDRAPRRAGLLALLCSTMFLNILNLSSVNIALPDIAADLDLSAAMLPWVISAYALTFAGFLLVGGRVADLTGRRKVLAVGFAIFVIFTIVSAAATSPTMLIAARGLQGIGAAITIPAALGILALSFAEGPERSRALAAFGAAGAVGFGCGLLLGGVVTDAFGWRWVFGLTAPPVAALLALAFVLVPPDPPDRASGHVDLPGALSATGGLLGLVFALNRSGDSGWGEPTTLAALLAGLALLAAFVALQRHVQEPLLPRHVWSLPNFAPVMAIAFCLYAAWTAVIYFLALTLQNVLGYGATEAGLALLPIAVGGFAGSTLAGRLQPRIGPRRLLVLGLSTYVAGIALMAFIDGGSAYWPHIFAAVTLAIAGNSVTFVSAMATALAHSDPGEESLLGGLFNTSVQVGGGLGLAIVSAVSAAQLGSGTGAEALLSSYHAAFWTATVIALAGLALTLLFIRDAAPTPGSPVKARP